MDGSLSPKLDTDVTESELKSETETQASKRRKVVEKTVVRVKIVENAGKLKNEGPPSDFWSWRKYGQKPIKGSPYPRGYYRCSTSKGCSAKKQLERCRTDASMLVITYTSSHNQPCPDVQNINLTQQFKEPEPQVQDTEDRPTTPKQEPRDEKEETQNQLSVTMTTIDEDVSEDQFHYLQSPISCPQDIMINPKDPFIENLEKDQDSLNLLLDEQSFSYPNLMMCTTAKSEENDFFDELEELPTSSVFNSFMRSVLFEDRVPAVPS